MVTTDGNRHYEGSVGSENGLQVLPKDALADERRRDRRKVSLWGHGSLVAGIIAFAGLAVGTATTVCGVLVKRCLRI